MNSYVVGSLSRITAVITDLNGNPVNPTILLLTIQHPNSTITDISGSIVNDSTGNYHADYLTSEIGLHTFEWEASGNATINQLGQFYVTQGLPV